MCSHKSSRFLLVETIAHHKDIMNVIMAKLCVGQPDALALTTFHILSANHELQLWP
jgi:hypothetical protein